MSHLRPYFLTRIGRPIPWAFEGGNRRFGMPHKREYIVVPRGIKDSDLTASVSSNDYDAQGNRTTRVPNAHGQVTVSVAGLEDPTQALEDLARAADKPYFAPFPAPARGESGQDGKDAIARIIEELESGVSRGKDEASPSPLSVARFRAFWASHAIPARMATPTLFSSKDGTVRGRWHDGPNRVLWINFPPKGPLGWSVSIPREGNYGLRKLNARCIDDQDIIPMALLLGVRCSR